MKVHCQLCGLFQEQQQIFASNQNGGEDFRDYQTDRSDG
jgi:hypothetical protein